MLIPMLLLASMIFVGKNITSFVNGTFRFVDVIKFIFFLLSGFHSSLNCLWFVYTLIILKLILRFSGGNRWLELIFLIGMPLIGILLDNIQPTILGKNIVSSSNAIVNTTIAFPFFFIGYKIKRFKNIISENKNISVGVVVFIICAITLFLCTKFNDTVWMWLNGYGSNFIYFHWCLLKSVNKKLLNSVII